MIYGQTVVCFILLHSVRYQKKVKIWELIYTQFPKSLSNLAGLY